MELVAFPSSKSKAWREIRQRYEATNGADDMTYWKDKLLAQQLGDYPDDDKVDKTSSASTSRHKKPIVRQERYIYGVATEDDVDDDESELYMAHRFTSPPNKEESEYESGFDHQNSVLNGQSLSGRRSMSSMSYISNVKDPFTSKPDIE